MALIGSFLVSSAMVILAMLLRGWAISLLWGWFIVPVFEVPTLTLASAIGISLTISVFTLGSSKTYDKSKSFSGWVIESGLSNVTTLVLWVLVSWLFFQITG